MLSLLLGVVTTLAGSGAAGWLDGIGTVARFSSPYLLVLDSAGTIYVADHGSHRIRVIIGGTTALFGQK